jgi:GNAT superfamily N-acetyltransferase
MPVIDRYRSEDRSAVDALFRVGFGDDAADASARRWSWQFGQNPNNPPDGPQIWLARDGAAVIGQHASMPVCLWIGGRELAASWGNDTIIAPDRQRQGIGVALFDAWANSVDAALGLGLSDGSHRLFQKLGWPDLGPVPCLIRPLTPRALRQPGRSAIRNGLVSALAAPVLRVVARRRRLLADVEPIEQFGPAFTELWRRLAPAFDFSVRRDADYLNWKYCAPPHVRYSIVALKRDDREAGYAVYRHIEEDRGRVTLLVDLLADPDDRDGVTTLLRWVDREARVNRSDKIRAFVMHAGYRRLMRASWYFPVASTLEFVVNVTAMSLPASFFGNTDRWHVMLGDSDQDR